MGWISSRALVLLACVVAINCGQSGPTSPDAPPAAGGGGGTGGGGGATGQTAISSDALFDDNDWESVLQAFGAGGTGSASHLHYLGRADGDYRQITLTVNSAQNSSSAAQVVSTARPRSGRTGSSTRWFRARAPSRRPTRCGPLTP
jgi:hypothetical protein